MKENLISKTFGIYKIINLINLKVYVGSTSRSFKERWASWRGDLRNSRTKNKHLLRAWNKYGEENFSFEVLEVIESKEKVLEREQHWIDTLKPEYNNRPQASSNKGFKHTKASKDKLSSSLRGRRKNPRPFCKCGEPVKEHYTKTGKFHSYYKTCGERECTKHCTPCSDETKLKISMSHKLTGHRPSFLGYTHSEETKKILSEKSKITSTGRKHTEETKAKLSSALKGNKNGCKSTI